jgi:hypothetical protein
MQRVKATTRTIVAVSVALFTGVPAVALAACPNMTAMPPVLKFGNVTAGTKATLTMEFVNTGGEPVKIDSQVTGGSEGSGEFEILKAGSDCEPKELAVNAHCKLEIAFSPLLKMHYSQNITEGFEGTSSGIRNTTPAIAEGTGK